jgi:hypothetical protein
MGDDEYAVDNPKSAYTVAQLHPIFKGTAPGWYNLHLGHQLQTKRYEQCVHTHSD